MGLKLLLLMLFSVFGGVHLIDARSPPAPGPGSITIDNTCGIINAGRGHGWVCNEGNALGGPCCSSFGYCGKSEGYCEEGCQPDFGSCGKSEDRAKCGPANDNKSCPDQQCCSKNGRCGIGLAFCTMPDNCQTAFGNCDSDDFPEGPDTLADDRPLVGKITYDGDIKSCKKPGTVALTYDDGPGEMTGDLLDVLNRYNAKATFFIAGNSNGRGRIDDKTKRHGELLKRMIRDGHQIGSHTYTHPHLNNITSDERIATMAKNERALVAVIEKYPTYMRTPFNQCDKDCRWDMKRLGYHQVTEDLDTQDYVNPDDTFYSKNIISEHFRKLKKDGNVLAIMHDTLPSVVELTHYMLEEARVKGWNLVTLGDCLEDDPKNWYRIPSKK